MTCQILESATDCLTKINDKQGNAPRTHKKYQSGVAMILLTTDAGIFQSQQCLNALNSAAPV